ncbi:MAG: glycosyltransferase family 2 protein [Verrucomicrobia bacterium]|nr:glycosyltransferase family 2 protein [Verrucomicrobiota bacterium]
MLSVIIPALNEEASIATTVAAVRTALEGRGIAHEIIVVDDGSRDRTGQVAELAGVRVIHHPQPGGYGRSLKDGIHAARYDVIAITDADGTYPNDCLPDLYEPVARGGFDMVVGARTGALFHGGIFKMPARWAFIWLSRYASGTDIPDVNSGLRVFRKALVERFQHTISDGFSFTTTITLAALLNGCFVKYVPISYGRRTGKSHVRYRRDMLRALQILVENILYYNPLKLFLLITNLLLVVAAAAAVVWAVAPGARLAQVAGNLASLSFVGAVVVAALGLVADLIRITRTPR